MPPLGGRVQARRLRSMRPLVLWGYQPIWGLWPISATASSRARNEETRRKGPGPSRTREETIAFAWLAQARATSLLLLELLPLLLLELWPFRPALPQWSPASASRR